MAELRMQNPCCTLYTDCQLPITGLIPKKPDQQLVPIKRLSSICSFPGVSMNTDDVKETYSSSADQACCCCQLGNSV